MNKGNLSSLNGAVFKPYMIKEALMAAKWLEIYICANKLSDANAPYKIIEQVYSPGL